MAKRLSMLLFYMSVLLCFVPYMLHAQVGYVRGEIINISNSPITGATAKIIFATEQDNILGEAVTDNEGKFKFRFSWDKINLENANGAKWYIEASKDGYLPGRSNIYLANNIIEPEYLPVILHPKIKNELIENVLYCQEDTGKVNIYLFDLVSPNLENADITAFLNTLNHKLKFGITNYLESYNILGNQKFNMRRCSSVLVEDESVAEKCCNTLNAPGIVWGYVKKEEDKLNTILTFTSKTKNEIITGYSPVEYSSDIDDILEPGKQVDSTFLAYAAFLIGNAHLKDNNPSLALQSFKIAKMLKIIPDTYSAILDKNIIELQNSLATINLTSVGGDH